jgi:hypothetical protein
MKRTNLIVIPFLICLSIICFANETDLIDKFIDSTNKEMVLFDHQRDLSKYEQACMKISETFILDLFNVKVKENNYINAFNKLVGDKRMSVTIDIERNFIVISFNFNKVINEINYHERYYFKFYPIPVHGNSIRYCVSYFSNKLLDTDAVDPETGPKEAWFGSDLIIQYSQSQKEYHIIARFEDTNLARYKGKVVFKDAGGRIIKPVELTGGPFKDDKAGEYFHYQKDDSITFTTSGCISPGPGSPHCKSYEVDWVLTPKNKLYATELRWDIKELQYDMAPQPLDENGHPIMTSTVIKLKP